MDSHVNGRPSGKEDAPNTLEANASPSIVPNGEPTNQSEMGLTKGLGVKCPAGKWVSVPLWDSWQIKKVLEGVRGHQAWWAPAKFDGTARRPAIQQKLDNTPPHDELNEVLHKQLNQASPDYRCNANFVAGFMLVADVDYMNEDGKHDTPPQDVRARMVEVMRDGLLPGQLGHMTPRGARIITLLPEPAHEPDEYLAALSGFLDAVKVTLEELGLADEDHGGYRVDEACFDLSRMFFAPNAEGRSAEVIVWGDALPPATEWANNAPPPPADENEDSIEAGDLKNQREKLLWLARNCELFHDSLNRAYVRLPGDTAAACIPIGEAGFSDWLRCEALEQLRMTCSTSLIGEVVATLEALARRDGAFAEVNLRVGGDHERIYLDLGRSDWRVVEIDANGWRVVDRSPVLFRRAQGMQALPEPERGGTLELLKPFVNGDEHAVQAVTACMLTALHPQLQYPVLLVHGEEGSAKSTLLRMIQRTIDPHEAELRPVPKDSRDLAIAADNSWILPLDNVSTLSQEMSDNLCRLSTGAAYSTRSLYTNRAEEIFRARRPVLLNGISQFSFRGDLLNRSLYVELDNLSDARRRPERELWEAFDEIRPKLLGALFDAVSAGLKCLGQVKLSRVARLADSAVFLTAVEIGMDWEVGEFNETLITSGNRGIQAVLDECVVCAVALRMFDKLGDWRGTPTGLLKALRYYADDDQKKRLPDSPNSVTLRLKRNARALRIFGCEVATGLRDTDGSRLIELRDANQAA